MSFYSKTFRHIVHQVTPCWKSNISSNAIPKYKSILKQTCTKTFFSTTASTRTNRNAEELTLVRLMGPDDANINGNVHGGVILKMMEEAGAIAATKFCNKNKSQDMKNVYSIPTLARIEKMDFKRPMFISEVAELDAKVTYTAYHSLEVTVSVYAENVIKGTKRKTNEAKMWYVPVNLKDVSQVLPVPKLIQASELDAIGYESYQKQKLQRSCSVLHLKDWSRNNEPCTVGFSRTTLTKLVGPSDAFAHGYCKGGVIMKMMDECGGITAAKHVKTTVVTAGIDATNFLAKSKIGSVLNFQGLVTFTSSNSLEVQVLVDSEHMYESGVQKVRAAEAFFTFVSMDHTGKIKPIPPLIIKTAQERTRYEYGKERYQDRQKQRLKTN